MPKSLEDGKEIKGVEYDLQGVKTYFTNKTNSEIYSSYRRLYEMFAKKDLDGSVVSLERQEYLIDALLGVKRPLDGSCVLDIGSGKFILARCLMQNLSISRMVCVDMVNTYYVAMREELEGLGVDFIAAAAEDLPFDNEFDVVFCSDVLEHVFNLGEALIAAQKSLKKGGEFIVQVPLEENLLQYRSTPEEPFVHLRSFTVNELVRQVECAGFKVVKTRFSGFDKYRLSRGAMFIFYLYSKIFRFLYSLRLVKNAAEPEYLAWKWSERYFGKLPQFHLFRKMIWEPIEVIALFRKV